MRLFHNIFYRRFKSIPLSYYKRGKELIKPVSVSSSVSTSLVLNDIEILPDYLKETSDLQFGPSNITEFKF